jgi:hypothetical protein
MSNVEAKTQVVATDLSALRAASQAERKQMVQSGKVRAPRRGTPERIEFDKLLFDSSMTAPTPEPVESVTPGETPVAPSAPSTAFEATEQPKPAEKPAEVKKYGEFDSIDDLLADYERKKTAEATLKSLADDQQRVISKLHATASDQGRVIATTKKELEEVKKIKEATPPPAPSQTVDVVDPPDPSKYDDGILGDQYQKDLYEYQRKLSAAVRAAPSSAAPTSEIEELKKRIMEAEAFLTDEKTRKAQESVGKEWSKVWEETADFQKKFGCTTSVPFETINNQLLIRDNAQTSNEERQAAQRFLDALPQVDKDNIDKTLTAINSMYAVENGVPKKRYKVFEAALMDNGLMQKFTPQSRSQEAAIKLAEADKLKKNATDKTVSALSVANQPGSNEPLTLGTAEEKVKRLTELAAKRAADPKAFRANALEWKEFNDLRVEFGAAMPRR